MLEIKRVSIIGLGLIGGSLAMAIKEKGLAKRIVGIPHREATLKEALEAHAIDEGTLDLIEGIAQADLIFVCTPIATIIPTIKRISPYLKRNSIVTDVGSTKAKIVKEAEKLVGKGSFFIGGHPMAGKELTGFSNAAADLFNGATYILTPTIKTNQEALRTLMEFLSHLNVKLIKIPPNQHDILVAGVSHLPLAVTVSLVNTIKNSGRYKTPMVSVASSGFRDTTRIASGAPTLGQEIFLTNKDNVLKMIKRFKASLNRLESLIRRGNAGAIAKELERAKEFRDSIYKSQK